MAPGLQLLENLALVAGGGVVTVIAQTFSDKRARRRVEREAHDQKVEQELERLRAELLENRQETAALRGYIQGKESVS